MNEPRPPDAERPVFVDQVDALEVFDEQAVQHVTGPLPTRPGKAVGVAFSCVVDVLHEFTETAQPNRTVPPASEPPPTEQPPQLT